MAPHPRGLGEGAGYRGSRGLGQGCAYRRFHQRASENPLSPSFVVFLARKTHGIQAAQDRGRRRRRRRAAERMNASLSAGHLPSAEHAG